MIVKHLRSSSTYIRDLCHQAYPSLLMLNKKDMNFVAALSYHEATIITQTMLK